MSDAERLYVERVRAGEYEVLLRLPHGHQPEYVATLLRRPTGRWIVVDDGGTVTCDGRKEFPTRAAACHALRSQWS